MKISKQPVTPVRSFFSFLKPSNLKALRKRGLDVIPSSDDLGKDSRHIDISPAALCSLKMSNPIALQNEDKDMEETVIVTALDSPPFCCHEDLVNMSRGQLIEVATALNDKLPGALCIEVKSTSTDRYIRNAIELIVGITKTVPATPKASKRSTMEIEDPAASVSPPSSPLVKKECRRQSHQGPIRLASLQEENEDETTRIAPGASKRTRSPSDAAAIPVLKKRRMSENPVWRARHIHARPSLVRTKSQTQRVPNSQISPPRSSRVLRSHSQKLPAEMKIMELDTTFVTMRRPRYRFNTSSSKASSSGITKTSPPTHGADMRDESLDKTETRINISNSNMSILTTSNSNTTFDVCIRDSDAPARIEDSGDMTFGFDEMILDPVMRSDSDMDIDISL